MEYKYNDDFQCISATDATETRVPKSQPVNVDDISAGAGTADGVHNIIKVIGARNNHLLQDNTINFNHEKSNPFK